MTFEKNMTFINNQGCLFASSVWLRFSHLPLQYLAKGKQTLQYDDTVMHVQTALKLQFEDARLTVHTILTGLMEI